jgi:hypothetical protein
VPRSSPASARTQLFEPEASLYVAASWTLIHSLLAAATLLIEVDPAPTMVLLAAVAIHGIVRYPRSPRLLVLHRDATWAVPERGLHARTLSPRTAWTTWYVELVLTGPGHTRIVLLVDQLDAEDWRRLQVEVRENGARAPRSS